MFSQHEVIHMSKKTKDNAKKVPFGFSRQKCFILRICYVISTPYYLYVGLLIINQKRNFLNGKKEIKMRIFRQQQKKFSIT